MDLITMGWEKKMRQEGPLALRMRPRSLEEFAGQADLLGEGKPLRRLITSDRVPSMILYGPPGTGKTTLALIIAATTRASFVQLNAVTAGVKDIREVVAGARERWSLQNRRTILFIDEIHRFNKAQQDALLAAVEQGTVIFIGATTENPFFYLNSPLLSRTRLFVFEPLGTDEILKLLQRALSDDERGLGKLESESDPAALRYLADGANGDARTALNALELAVSLAERRGGKIKITAAAAAEALRSRAYSYDRAGDDHYDTASAFIKSIRGSDPDAALYWLARMLKGGEDPLFIARRLVISAAEDIGNADPRALPLAVAASQAVQLIGLPEGRIPLAQATLYLAAAPKSNASYKAIEEALAAVEESTTHPVPPHLRGTGYRGAARLGHGKGYLYPHDHPGHFVDQRYLPPEMAGKRFYRPGTEGFERQIKDRLDELDRLRRAAAAHEKEKSAAQGGAAAGRKGQKAEGKGQRAKRERPKAEGEENEEGNNKP
ncbi:MAG: replication-associated recombination protein A [Firmicutes bacterium]|nr:replication-associated recombination protein A [Bacillota bacterium]